MNCRTLVPVNLSEVIGTAIVLYDYQAQQNEELSLSANTRILILEKSDDGWWRGQSGHKIGWFPSNYIQVEHFYLTKDVENNSAEQNSICIEKPADLGEKSWYYGKISRAQCDSLLNNHGSNGDFLVRDSETNNGDFSVSLKVPQRNMHFRVRVEGESYFIGRKKFLNFDQLICYYQRIPIFVDILGEAFYLARPLPKSSDNFTFGQTTHFCCAT